MIELSQRVLEALSSPEEPAYPDGRSTHHCEKLPDDAIVIGSLPDSVRRVYLLFLTMRKKQWEEQHRRCVQFFGRENYDNERIEFMVYQDVRNDPEFAGADQIELLYKRLLLQHFPKPEGKWAFPFGRLGPGWVVYLEPWKDPWIKIARIMDKFRKAEADISAKHPELRLLTSSLRPTEGT